MNRRQYLAGVAVGTGTVLAGCGGFLSTTVTLDDPETSVDDDGTEKALTYRHDGDRVAILGLEQRTEQTSPTDRFPFRLSVPHSDETTIESFRFDLRTPYSATEVPAEVYLQAPGGNLWPNIAFREVEDGWTRIALDDTEGLGGGTLTLETIVQPYDPVERVEVRGEVELSTSVSRARYRIEPDTELELVTT